MNRHAFVCQFFGHVWRMWRHPAVPSCEVVIRCIRCGVMQEPSEGLTP